MNRESSVALRSSSLAPVYSIVRGPFTSQCVQCGPRIDQCGPWKQQCDFNQCALRVVLSLEEDVWPLEAVIWPLYSAASPDSSTSVQQQQQHQPEEGGGGGWGVSDAGGGLSCLSLCRSGRCQHTEHVSPPSLLYTAGGPGALDSPTDHVQQHPGQHGDQVI